MSSCAYYVTSIRTKSYGGTIPYHTIIVRRPGTVQHDTTTHRYTPLHAVQRRAVYTDGTASSLHDNTALRRR